ncbi:CRISPR-associated Cmr3 family protein [mine drainage metagenome]|uniref:CRISPR-associated Cmr3 family protein n=1 Tax=mine drainage metagenome TaxID=410659 RepID=T1D3P2_9ZZZZ
MLVDAAVDISAFANSKEISDPVLHAVLGTPQKPGAFRISWFSVARRNDEEVEPLIALPTDVAATEGDDVMRYLHPQPLTNGLRTSCTMGQIAIVQQKERSKPEGGLWFAGEGLAVYMRGESLSRKKHTVGMCDLWKTNARIGIALDPDKHAAVQGALFTSEAIALAKNVGFLTRIEGADGTAPKGGLLRLGGDGHSVRVEACKVAWPEPDWDRIAKERRFRLVLATPGLFEQGWLPPGIRDDGVTWNGPCGVSARLVCAAVPRAQVVSGWDLARRAPKAALRAAPAGSVYWFDATQVNGGTALIAALQKLAAEGFGCVSGYPDRARLAEGFNNVMIANWAIQ